MEGITGRQFHNFLPNSLSLSCLTFHGLFGFQWCEAHADMPNEEVDDSSIEKQQKWDLALCFYCSELGHIVVAYPAMFPCLELAEKCPAYENVGHFVNKMLRPCPNLLFW